MPLDVTVYRCPFANCPMNSLSSPGWLQRSSQIAHINSQHLSSRTAQLPTAALGMFSICGRCGLILTNRGCQACGGRPGLFRPSGSFRVAPQADESDPLEYRALPDVEEIIATRVPVIDHVPRGARQQWCEALADAIDRVAVSPSIATYTASLMLAKVVLTAFDRGGRRAKRQAAHICLQRLRQYGEADWPTLWNAAKSKAAPSAPTHTDSDNIVRSRWRSRVLRILSNKGISKAAKELVSSGLHEATPDVMQKLSDLHPPSPPLPIDLTSINHDQWSPLSEEDDLDLMRDVVRRFSDASAGGPSQLLPVHVKEALKCGNQLAANRLLKALIRFANVCAAGKLPTCFREYVSSAQLLPMKKNRAQRT